MILIFSTLYILVAVYVWVIITTTEYKNPRTTKEIFDTLRITIKEHPVVALNLFLVSLVWFVWISAVIFWRWKDKRGL